MKSVLSLVIIIFIVSFMITDLEARKRKSPRSSSKRKPASIQNSHVDFDDLVIEGQNKKSSAFYFLERVNKNGESKVKVRKNFRSEIMESL
jgi:hypothetical protein